MAYAIDEFDFKALQEINKALFGDGSHLTPDARRDLANRMHVLLLRAEPIIDLAKDP